MTTGKKIKYALWLVLAIVIAGFLCYNLPRTDVVQITGTDTKYTGKSGSSKITTDRAGKQGGGKIQIQDVRFINAITREGNIRVFRNEDTGWGWPPYFKFDSADVTAQAQSFLETNPKPWVLVRYYGWRIQMLSMFPNAVSMRSVEKTYNHLPIFNIVFLLLLTGVTIFGVTAFRRFVRRIKARFGKKTPGSPSGGSTGTRR
ncbi:hypothetical protein D3OALGA1CA_4773 [Olavius algarvensis associated proteobacterium Delta 3]|nr:hypothetical protein D3OALGB2SA_2047 [Olavius algarvensis associated proteobacterium Delta 3]CAB5156670.1 hypothetical protein D3OALGA1CA_4773 [Olavius algarvensis associated proteobacterium Delta 3]